MNKLTKNAVLLSFGIFSSIGFAQEKVKVHIDKVEGGTLITQGIPQDGMVKIGDKVTVKAIPNKGYIIDATYYSPKTNMPWLTFIESMSPEYTFVVDKEMSVGASFIKKEVVQNLNITQDIVYAKPGKKTLKYDVYSPKKAKNLPCIIIIHGGGWSSNNEDIMRGMARVFANTGKYVVFSLDYRWLGNLDGDKTPTSMHQIIEDVYGGIIHIRENATKYGGNPNQLLLTGDSAGGHLAASTANFVERLGTGGQNFTPSYMPNKSIEQVKQELMTSIKATAPSYGVFQADMLNTRMQGSSEEERNAVAPINFIPNVQKRAIPQLLIRGSEDPLIKDEHVKSYERALVKAGQRVEYIQVGGASHAFYDWKPDADTQSVFAKYGVYHANQMMLFFEDVLKNDK